MASTISSFEPRRTRPTGVDDSDAHRIDQPSLPETRDPAVAEAPSGSMGQEPVEMIANGFAAAPAALVAIIAMVLVAVTSFSVIATQQPSFAEEASAHARNAHVSGKGGGQAGAVTGNPQAH